MPWGHLDTEIVASGLTPVYDRGGEGPTGMRGLTRSGSEEVEMNRCFRTCLIGSTLGVLMLALAAPSFAQDARMTGTVFDEWENPIEGATVRAEGTEGGAPGSATTGANGEFLIEGLDSESYNFTFRAAGYQGVRQSGTRVRTGAVNRPLTAELSVLQRGVSFEDETTFVSDPPGTTINFDDDGTFEIEDADGEGHGTYGIEQTTATLVVREHDADDKFSISDPLIAEFSSEDLTNFMIGNDKFIKK